MSRIILGFEIAVLLIMSFLYRSWMICSRSGYEEILFGSMGVICVNEDYMEQIKPVPMEDV